VLQTSVAGAVLAPVVAGVAEVVGVAGVLDATGVLGAAGVERVDALTGLGLGLALGGAGVVPPVFAWSEPRAAERLGERLGA
jgi:hypothetical protein